MIVLFVVSINWWRLGGGLIWQEDEYQKLQEYVRAELNDAVVEIAKQVEAILTQAFAINKRLKGRVDISVAFALSDIKAQLGQS